MKARRRTSATVWVLGALLAVVATLGGLTLHGLRQAPHVAAVSPVTESSRRAAARTAPELAEARPPWQAPRARVSAPPPGTVPVAQIAPPPPDPSVPMPPAPVEPPNPAEHRPPLHDPAALDRARPPR